MTNMPRKPTFAPIDGARQSRQVVEEASERLKQGLAQQPVCPSDAASMSRARFDREFAEPVGIDKPFRALDHIVLQTAGRVAMTAKQDEIDLKSLRQAVGVWKGHAGHHRDLDAARKNAAAAFEQLRNEALPHKKPQLDASKRKRRFVDALWQANRHSPKTGD